MYDPAVSGLLLVIGNRNYSSWSMRAWLAIRQTGTPFREETIWLDEDRDRERRLGLSPAGRVPILRDGSLTIWDSLAIVEYLAEAFPGGRLWPADRADRARARSLASEMHAGFQAIRSRLPLNCRARTPWRDRGPEVAAEIDRVARIWREARGPFLFGAWCAADAFFAPVASRFRTYGVALEARSRRYADAILERDDVNAWMAGAEAEGHPQPEYDALL